VTSAELPCHTSALFFKEALLSTVNGETYFHHKQNLMYFYDVGEEGGGREEKNVAVFMSKSGLIQKLFVIYLF
jgi:hypothetical protein